MASPPHLKGLEGGIIPPFRTFLWEILCKVTSLGLPGAFAVMMQAHRSGESIVVRTHREHGELLTERLVEQGLCASMRKL